jgi:hypothetical protein
MSMRLLIGSIITVAPIVAKRSAAKRRLAM